MAQFIHSTKTPDDLADLFARQMIEWINESDKDTFHLALSGGKTPSLLFSLLADKYRKEVSWPKIHFWWGDERMVEPDNPESNFGVVNKLLFQKIGLMQTQIHRIKGEADLIGESERYSLEIQAFVPIVNGWPNFDLIMLGLGDDGHTASIFSAHLELMESEGITAIALHPETGQKRITLTGKVLNNAKKVAFLASGRSKSTILNQIIHHSPGAAAYPASHISPAGELHWFADEECLGEREI